MYSLAPWDLVGCASCDGPAERERVCVGDRERVYESTVPVSRLGASMDGSRVFSLPMARMCISWREVLWVWLR